MSWHIYGYGICVSDIKEQSLERLQKLISMAPKFQKRIQEWFKDCEITDPAYEDYLEFDQIYMLELATILKEVILETEDIELLACDSYDGTDYLLYSPVYPWEQGNHRQLMTEEAVQELFQKYVSILTNEVIETDYQSVENGV